MKNYKIFFITITSLFSFCGYAQKNKTAVASKKYDNYASIDAIQTYERVAAKGYKSIDMFQKLGDMYYFNNELDKSAKWYGELFSLTTDLDSKYYYRFGQSLKAIGENEKAKLMLEKFNELSEIEIRDKQLK